MVDQRVVLKFRFINLSAIALALKSTKQTKVFHNGIPDIFFDGWSGSQPKANVIIILITRVIEHKVDNISYF